MTKQFKSTRMILFIWELRAVAFEKLKKPEEELKAYDKAIEVREKNNQLDSNSSPVWYLWYLKGLVYDDLGKYHEAIDAYNKSITLNPNDSTNTAAMNAKKKNLKKLNKFNL